MQYYFMNYYLIVIIIIKIKNKDVKFIITIIFIITRYFIAINLKTDLHLNYFIK